MSVFQPIDPRVANDRRKALLAKLAQRFNAGGPGGGGIGSPSIASSGLPFRHEGLPTAVPRLTQIGRNLPAGLAALLGPGGMGRPIAGEFSPGRGMEIASPRMPVGPPHPINAPDAHNPNAPIAPYPTAPPPAPPAGPPVTSPAMPPPVNPPTAPPPGSTTSAPPVNSHIPVPAQTTASTPGLIPLGNGLVYDPLADQVINPAAAHSFVS